MAITVIAIHRVRKLKRGYRILYPTFTVSLEETRLGAPALSALSHYRISQPLRRPLIVPQIERRFDQFEFHYRRGTIRQAHEINPGVEQGPPDGFHHLLGRLQQVGLGGDR